LHECPGVEPVMCVNVHMHGATRWRIADVSRHVDGYFALSCKVII